MTKIQDIRHRTPGNSRRSLSRITTIVRHHSATVGGDFDSFWRHWNGKLGWGTGGYHEIILRDGTVQVCYPPEIITNGVGNNNSYTYHICLVGNGSFTEAQEEAWSNRVAFNMDRLGISLENVKGHNEMPGASTACPGVDMNKVREAIRNGFKDVKEGYFKMKMTKVECEAVASVLEDWTDGKRHRKPLNRSWLDKAKKGELTYAEAVRIQYEADRRGLR